MPEANSSGTIETVPTQKEAKLFCGDSGEGRALVEGRWQELLATFLFFAVDGWKGLSHAKETTSSAILNKGWALDTNAQLLSKSKENKQRPLESEFHFSASPTMNRESWGKP